MVCHTWISYSTYQGRYYILSIAMVCIVWNWSEIVIDGGLRKIQTKCHYFEYFWAVSSRCLQCLSKTCRTLHRKICKTFTSFSPSAGIQRHTQQEVYNIHSRLCTSKCLPASGVKLQQTSHRFLVWYSHPHFLKQVSALSDRLTKHPNYGDTDDYMWIKIMGTLMIICE